MSKYLAALSLAVVFYFGFLSGLHYAKPKDISRKLQKVDETYYQLYETKRGVNDIIISDVASGNIGLYVRTSTASTSRVDDGNRAKCHIHESDAQRIIEVTKRADECSSRLTGLQAWVKEHIK